MLHHILDRDTVTLRSFEKVVKSLIASDPVLANSDQYKSIMKQSRAIFYTAWNGEKINVDSTTSLVACLVDYFTKNAQGEPTEGQADDAIAKKSTIVFELTYQNETAFSGQEDANKHTGSSTGSAPDNITVAENSPVKATPSKEQEDHELPSSQTRKDEIDDLLKREIQKEATLKDKWSYILKKSNCLSDSHHAVVFIGLVAITATVVCTCWKHGQRGHKLKENDTGLYSRLSK